MKTSADLMHFLRNCPVCAHDLIRNPHNDLALTCWAHGDFLIPSDEEIGAPVRWKFVSVRRDTSDLSLLNRLIYCPCCREYLVLNTHWMVKNCAQLHGDFHVRAGLITFDYDEPEYEIVRSRDGQLNKKIAMRTRDNCPTCNGWVQVGDKLVRTRVTAGMVCQTCGYDYGKL